MSTALSSAATVAEYDQAKRQDARLAGHPIPRTAYGSKCLGPDRDVFVFFKKGSHLKVLHDGRTEAATEDHVVSAFTGNGCSALAIDRVAGKAMASLVTDRRLGLDVTVHRAAPVSLRYAELASVLRARFYAPTGVHTGIGESWLASFGVGVDQTLTVLRHAHKAAPPSEGFNPDTVATLYQLIGEIKDELEATVHPGPDRSGKPRTFIDRNFSFELTEALGEFLATATIYDPMTRERGLLSGDLVRAEVISHTDPARVRLDDALSVKEGEDVAILTPTRVGLSTLGAYSVEGDDLYATISSKRRAGAILLRNSTEVLLSSVKVPFLSVPRRGWTRWSGKKLRDPGQEPPKRPIPAYISLAGGVR